MQGNIIYLLKPVDFVRSCVNIYINQSIHGIVVMEDVNMMRILKEILRL